MKKLFDAADRYIAGCGWKTIAVMKFCLISLGMMIGMLIRPQHKKGVMTGALCVFVLTYVPLMAGFAMALLEMRGEAPETEE